MPAEIVEGNLFDSEAQYITHQCNCVTWVAAHLAKDMFYNYPYADIYTPRRNNRDKHDEPGTIIIKGNGKDQRYVINLLGQYYPGKPSSQRKDVDSPDLRKKYFFNGLQKIIEIPNLKSVAFPWGIGCGAAGGDWNFYKGLIDKMADFIADEGVKVYIYKLPE